MNFESKFKPKDKVKEFRGSFLYVVKSYYYDEESNVIIYALESIDCPGYIKYLPEDKLQFVSL